MDEFPFAFDIYAPPFAPKPMATETGYSTFFDGPSEAAHAKYLPRLFCEYFRKGVQRTFSCAAEFRALSAAHIFIQGKRGGVVN